MDKYSHNRTFITNYPPISTDKSLDRLIIDTSNYHVTIEPDSCAMIHIHSTQASKQLKITVKQHATAYFFVHNEFQTVEIECEPAALVWWVQVINVNNTYDQTIDVELSGEKSNAFLRIFLSVQAHQCLTLVTKQLHHASASNSDLFMIGFLNDYSHVNYYGTIVVDKQLSNIRSKQHSTLLTEGYTSSALAIPELDIKSNDVTCSHGFAAGQVDQKISWFLQSRGIEDYDIPHLIMHAYCTQSLNELPEGTFKHCILNEIEKSFF